MELVSILETWMKLQQDNEQLPHVMELYSWLVDDGPSSTRLSTWIIRIVGDPYLCPFVNLRLKMLLLIDINPGNIEQAMESFMLASSHLDRNGDSHAFMKPTFIRQLIRKFNDDICDYKNAYEIVDDLDYLGDFGLKLADKIKQHRNKREMIHIHDVSHGYSIGLKTLAEPWELQCLTTLLKYVRDGIHVRNQPIDTVSLSLVVDGLSGIVDIFKVALQEPELVNVTAECIMDVIEAVLLWTKDQINDGIPIENLDDCFHIKWVNCLLGDLKVNTNYEDDIWTFAKTPIGMEIIQKYKERICKLRSMFTKYSLIDVSSIDGILYNDRY